MYITKVNLNIPKVYFIFNIGVQGSILFMEIGVHLFFLFLHQHIDCGYSLQPPR